MSLEKQKKTDSIQTLMIKNHYVLQIREKNQILEDGQEISASFQRYVLQPDADVSEISDATVKAQFQAVMTDEVKQNYETFKVSQTQPENA